jgi:endoglucanase
MSCAPPLPRTNTGMSTRDARVFAGAVVSAFVAAAACGPLGPSGGGGSDADAGGGGAGGGGGSQPTDSGASDSSGGSPTDRSAPGGYSVVGATIYDANHVPHLFHGVDRPSLEWSPSGDQLSLSDFQLMASWKANVVRIALNQDFWLSASPKFDPGYAAVVDQSVKWAEKAGLDVILDLHWSDRGDFNQTPNQQRMADAHSIDFWKSVAATYKGDGRVMFELYNEPHDVAWSVWLNGGPSGDGFTVAGMQQLYDAVRSTSAENLVFIGGLQFAYDLSGVPSNRVNGHNIVWVTHPYNQPNKQPANWDTGFGFLTATDPVMATEFGDVTGCGTSYYASFLSYADAHKTSWSGWAWYVSGCSFPSIIADWSGTPTAAGQLEKAALASY